MREALPAMAKLELYGVGSLQAHGIYVSSFQAHGTYATHPHLTRNGGAIAHALGWPAES